MKRFLKLGLLVLTSFVLFSCAKVEPDLVVDYNSYGAIENPVFNSSIMITEDNYVSKMESVVEPYLNARIETNTMDTATGDYIYYELFKVVNPKGTIVMFHGFSEFTNKFNETAYYFVKNGYNVLRFDHNGHGYSIRKVDNLSKVYTNDWENYLEDANELIQKVVIPASNGKPLYLYAHSMGGGIGVAFLEKYPEVFKCAALNCPMIEINCGPLSENFSQFICRYMRATGRGKNYIPGNHDYEVYTDDINEDWGDRTASKNRYIYIQNYRNKYVKYQTNGATYAWTDECITATKRIRSKKEAAKIEVPVLLFQAENDIWVKPKGQNILRKNTDKVTLAYYPEVEHEIYGSHDKYLPVYYNMILDWYAKN